MYVVFTNVCKHTSSNKYTEKQPSSSSLPSIFPAIKMGPISGYRTHTFSNTLITHIVVSTPAVRLGSGTLPNLLPMGLVALIHGLSTHRPLYPQDPCSVNSTQTTGISGIIYTHTAWFLLSIHHP